MENWGGQITITIKGNFEMFATEFGFTIGSSSSGDGEIIRRLRIFPKIASSFMRSWTYVNDNNLPRIAQRKTAARR
jgi:hypothetical protein